MSAHDGRVDPEFWRGKRVFLTGHTGFKGSWLSLWLQGMGATVHGFSLAPPTTPALFDEARVAEGMQSTIGDIRDLAAVRASLVAFRPDIVIHMAAQPLVRLSYAEPVETYATNVMGTVHVMEAVRAAGTVKAVVSVTTDKCYENKEWVWGYREDEPMGGYDPYSNSKGCAELVTSAYRRSFMQKEGIALASGRAGNVIGGGDWALDRLVPDILRAFEAGQPVVIRNPHSTRPWQHVLEPLSGYLVLAQRLYTEGQSVAEGWNFGPKDEDARPVQWIVEHMVGEWGDGARWQLDGADHPHEAGYLKLDISKARHRLGWQPRWALAEALERILQWHRAWLARQDMRQVCHEQIALYMTSMNKESLS
ncbi:CDP-glucose 4,6-dehydratase [Xylophilus sp. GOD-11R]|uniref:CDP-glucose 4,6-dehydratase n=1 Tax=Xylophilus sp. GOD-11R TaxID=3089814 RepID=UPI00298BCF78|nr:CDP-glucose 4,6-dehydratase [Xylophilus sp. GOD-11R]WPB58072.1 CDP-glucose 4,6-dehydratase [Xylophilus sp. GOD-11R]